MTTEPDETNPDGDSPMDGRGAEIGIGAGEGSSFEPEEDPEGHSEDGTGIDAAERTAEKQAAENG